MTHLERLIGCVESGLLLSPESFAELDINLVLNGRDKGNFEDEWLSLFQRLKEVKLPPEEEKFIHKLRETAFKRVFNCTNHSDLAGYVSDDFELLARGIEAKVEHSFLSKIFESYLQSRIPTDDVNTPGAPIVELLKQLN